MTTERPGSIDSDSAELADHKDGSENTNANIPGNGKSLSIDSKNSAEDLGSQNGLHDEAIDPITATTELEAYVEPLEAVLTPEVENAPTPPPPTAKQEVISFLKTVALFLVLAFFLRASVVEAFKIPSASMVPTLRIGDHILVSKLSYGLRLPLLSGFLYQYGEPVRGDIVVFTRDEDPSTNIIKRVVGIPGDLIEVRNTKVLINNQMSYEPYARYELNGIKNFGPERVPAGHIFMLGDNRDHSRDSRFWDDSPWLSIQNVKGRAMIIYWSWDPSWRDRLGKILR